ncbi:MAG: hypothetical protein IPJ69_05465 [Deltaproteobacteria bacterium]|nr:MAG: hypothetical protein IPJ69_05465 [Deltaproteobacteria bacterium]
MPMFHEGGYNNYDIEVSRDAALAHYKKFGFQETTITFQKEDISDTKTTVTFFIHEGPQTRVKKIEFEGLHEVSAKKIKKELLTKEQTLFESGYYQPQTVQQDTLNLPQILESKELFKVEYRLKRRRLTFSKIKQRFILISKKVLC